MERLTKTYSDGTHGASDSLPCGENSYNYKNLLIEKLGKYEDLEEQGLLLRLPCKVGDTVHELDIFLERNPLIIEMRVTDIIIRDDDIYFELVDLYDDNYTNSVLITEFGRTVFLTKSEAEEKLKELRGNNGKSEK